MKSFDEFVKKGVIRKGSPQPSMAKDLIERAEHKENNLKERIEKIRLKEENANDFIEDCYSILMSLIRSKLFSDGYNPSGYGAHEAEISFMKNLGFDEKDIVFMDELRKFRNQINYEGKKFDKEYAEKVIEFTKRIYLELKIIITKNK